GDSISVRKAAPSRLCGSGSRYNICLPESLANSRGPCVRTGCLHRPLGDVLENLEDDNKSVCGGVSVRIGYYTHDAIPASLWCASSPFGRRVRLLVVRLVGPGGRVWWRGPISFR